MRRRLPGDEEEAMSLGELETYASAKAAEEAQAAAQAAQAVEEAQAAMQAAQAAMRAGQAAKLSKERRLGLLQKRHRRQGEWDVVFGRTPAGVRPTPDGAEDEEDDIRDFGSAAAAAAAAGGGQDGGAGVFR